VPGFVKGQRNDIFYVELWERAAYFYILWWALGKGSVMVYFVVGFGQGQRNGIFCGEVWERAA
jgi:hypothetical protein